LRLRDLKGLGVKTEQQLNEIGIHSVDDLKRIGAVKAFIMLKRKPLLGLV
jgi:DNA transformation protein